MCREAKSWRKGALGRGQTQNTPSTRRISAVCELPDFTRRIATMNNEPSTEKCTVSYKNRIKPTTSRSTVCGTSRYTLSSCQRFDHKTGWEAARADTQQRRIRHRPVARVDNRNQEFLPQTTRKGIHDFALLNTSPQARHLSPRISLSQPFSLLALSFFPIQLVAARASMQTSP